MKNTITLLISILCFGRANGQGQVLDSSFGSYGKVASPIQSYSSDQALSVVCQSDGKIIVGGYSGIVSQHTRAAMIRYDKNGGIDSSFGYNGRVILDPGNGTTYGHVAVQKLMPSGVERVIFGGIYSSWGSSNPDFLVIGGYLPNGTLDASFGIGGIVQFPVSWVSEIIVDPSGRILVAGQLGLAKFGVFRLLPNGSLDNSFGLNGYTSVQDTGFYHSNAIALQADGKILVGGTTTFPPLYPQQDMGLARYLPNGIPDSSFGVNGIVVISPDTNIAEIRSIVVQADDKILACGFSDTGTGNHFYVSRLFPNGAVDGSFGQNGFVRTGFGSNQSWANEVLVQNDGKIYAVGYAAPASAHSYAFAIVRYKPDGSVDSTFGVNGRDTSNIGSWSGALAATITPELKIVAAGWSHFSMPPDALDDFALMQYLSGLSLGVVDLSRYNPPILYPNPVTGVANLSYELGTDDVITLRLIDVTGKTVQMFYDSQLRKIGQYNDTLRFSDTISSGYYFLQLKGSEGSYTIKLQVQQ